ncbi:MAG: DUF1028 domain-containing protein, partial [Deinococcus sp.]|nr:DUF1028 domain-containing protein [Deinococcus sp.]
MIHLTTFSIAARCPRTGMLGVAVCTAVPGVGSLAPFVRPGVGAIATQSYVNPYLGIDGLHLLSQGLTAKQALERLLAADPLSDIRQLSIVDAKGRVAAHTGANCTPWHGHRTGKGYSAAGNMLVDEATVNAMAEEFEKRSRLELP